MFLNLLGTVADNIGGGGGIPNGFKAFTSNGTLTIPEPFEHIFVVACSSGNNGTAATRTGDAVNTAGVGGTGGSDFINGLKVEPGEILTITTGTGNTTISSNRQGALVSLTKGGGVNNSAIFSEIISVGKGAVPMHGTFGSGAHNDLTGLRENGANGSAIGSGGGGGSSGIKWCQSGWNGGNSGGGGTNGSGGSGGSGLLIPGSGGGGGGSACYWGSPGGGGSGGPGIVMIWW